MFRNYTSNISDFSLDQLQEKPTGHNIWAPQNTGQMQDSYTGWSPYSRTLRANPSCWELKGGPRSRDPRLEPDLRPEGSASHAGHFLQSHEGFWPGPGKPSRPLSHLFPAEPPEHEYTFSAQNPGAFPQQAGDGDWSRRQYSGFPRMSIPEFLGAVPNYQERVHACGSHEQARQQEMPDRKAENKPHELKSDELHKDAKIPNAFRRDRHKPELVQRHDFDESKYRISDEDSRIIDKYFSQDPSGRVKVTAAFLNRRFSREKEQFAKTKLINKMGSLSAGRLVLVVFKAGRLDVFSVDDRQKDRMEAGAYVMVRADRGKDLGRVVEPSISLLKARFLKLLQLMESHTAFSDTSIDGASSSEFLHRNSAAVAEAWENLSQTRGKVYSQDKGKSAQEADEKRDRHQAQQSVISLARLSEVRQLGSKCQDEERVCRSLLGKIYAMREAHDCMYHMALVDAEYQFDRKKLIIYYSSDRRIDFRELVRELYKVYKTRIWMSAVNGQPYSRKKSCLAEKK